MGLSLWVLLPNLAGPDATRLQYSQMAMGVQVRLTLYAESEAKAESAAKSAFARFSELEAIMSDYRPDSEVRRLSPRAATEAVSVSEDLRRVLGQARRVAFASGDRFDITCGPLSELWRTCRDARRLPSPDELAAAKAAVGTRYWTLLPAGVRLRREDVRFDLGGIAKGDACDQAIAALTRAGCPRAMVEAGGDIAVGEAPPGTDGWKVEVPALGKTLTLRNQALSTSGNSEQFFEVAGVRYGHLLDPSTGLGTTTQRQVTVIGRRGLDTDPWATALCLMPREKWTRALQDFGLRAFTNEDRTARD
ncbi:MAG: FAD:protein FMN transferase [Fimbriimonadaceae bacterium]|nr:FAD:protein FMN transferase [Fimbriimonadaceae bacterium]